MDWVDFNDCLEVLEMFFVIVDRLSKTIIIFLVCFM